METRFLGRGQFGPKGLNWQDLLRKPLSNRNSGPLGFIDEEEEDFLKFFPLSVYGSYMLPWQQEFQSNQLINLMQPSHLPEDALHEAF